MLIEFSKECHLLELKTKEKLLEIKKSTNDKEKIMNSVKNLNVKMLMLKITGETECVISIPKEINLKRSVWQQK